MTAGVDAQPGGLPGDYESIKKRKSLGAVGPGPAQGSAETLSTRPTAMNVTIKQDARGITVTPPEVRGAISLKPP